jgi:hypothetical protein
MHLKVLRGHARCALLLGTVPFPLRHSANRSLSRRDDLHHSLLALFRELAALLTLVREFAALLTLVRKPAARLTLFQEFAAPRSNQQAAKILR